MSAEEKRVGCGTKKGAGIPEAAREDERIITLKRRNDGKGRGDPRKKPSSLQKTRIEKTSNKMDFRVKRTITESVERAETRKVWRNGDHWRCRQVWSRIPTVLDGLSLPTSLIIVRKGSSMSCRTEGGKIGKVSQAGETEMRGEGP